MSRVVCRPPTGPPKKRAPVVRAADPVGRRHTVRRYNSAATVADPPERASAVLRLVGGWRRGLTLEESRFGTPVFDGDGNNIITS